jgi:SagB-type dehydrogenase family enzyme
VSGSDSTGAPVAPEGRRYRRSRAVVGEWHGSELVAVDSDSQHRVIADASLGELLRHLDRWTTVDELRSEGLDIEELQIDRLASLGVVEIGTGAESEVPGAGHWDPLELMVHRRTANGGLRQDVPETARPDLFKPLVDAPVTPLVVDERAPERSLVEVLIGSRRAGRLRPLRLTELSLLLYHAARIVRSGENPALGDYALRPFAGGGARSELEVYVVADAVDGLAPGAHHYLAARHELALVRPRDDYQAQMVRTACTLDGRQLGRPPAALIVVTAVFARVMWKFDNLGLMLVYEDAGCLLQTLGTVAAALGILIGPAVATTEPETSRWLGLDPLAESEVACMALESPAAEGRSEVGSDG